MENKRKYKEIESDGPDDFPNRGAKRQKMRESKDSGRTVSLMTKKKNAKKFKTPKVNIPIVNIKKSESEEERFDWGSDKSNQFSDELKSDNQQILEDAEDEIIMSESACSSDIQYCQTFSTSLLDIYKLIQVVGDGNCLFRAICQSAFGSDSMHLTVRQNVCDHLIKNQNRFEEAMEEGTDIKDDISKMLIDGEWGGYVELVAFSELYNIQIQVYDSLGSQQPINTVSTADGRVTITILFSGDHYDSLIPRFHEETDLIEYKELSDIDNDEIAPVYIRKIERDNVYVNEYPTRYTDETMKSILEYLKDSKFPEAIEELRRKKNTALKSNDATTKEKIKARNEFDNAKRQFRAIVQKNKRFKLITHKFQGKEYQTISRNWSYNEAKNKEKDKKGYDHENTRRRSKSVDQSDSNKLNEWLIVSYEWQIPIILYNSHTKSGSHLRIQPTQAAIIDEGYKWDSMYPDIRDFFKNDRFDKSLQGKYVREMSSITLKVVNHWRDSK